MGSDESVEQTFQSISWLMEVIQFRTSRKSDPV